MDPRIFGIVLRDRKITYAITNNNLIVQELHGFVEIVCDNLQQGLGRHLIDIVPELIGYEETLVAILAGNMPHLHLVRINRELSDGQTVYLSLKSLPYRDQTGAIIGLLHIVEDVTEMGNIEQRLVHRHNELRFLQAELADRNEELAHANIQLEHIARAKDEFLASMSHELRTPLTAVLGLSETLRSGDYGPLNDLQQQSAARIEESGRYLLALINDILDIAKIEAGKVELDIVPVSVTDVCLASLRMIKQMAQKKHIEVVTDTDSSLMTIMADVRRLKQILVNLLSNAVKFTPDGGTVGLDVYVDQHKHTMCFAIWDTGVGIEQEYLTRLFKPFVQFDNRLSRNYNGAGLGLALSYRLTLLHGGNITVDSTPGHGSRFIVSLPWSGRHSIQQDSPVFEDLAELNVIFADLARSDLTVLLAEDHEDSAVMICDYLRLRGFRVLHAKDGEEALFLARNGRPNLILMDVQLPQIDGLEVIRHIRTAPDLATVPIIALTALAMPGDRERCLAAGASAYLCKPIRFADLAQTIAIQLHHYRAVGESTP